MQKPVNPIREFIVELSFLGLSLVTVTASLRSFSDGSHFGNLLLLTLLLCLFLILMNHLGVKKGISHSLAFLFGLAIQIYIALPETLVAGLPTRTGVSKLLEEVSNGIRLIIDDGLPISGGRETFALFSIAIIVAIPLSSYAAFKNRRPFESLFPQYAIFIMFLILGPILRSITMVILMAGATSLFILFHRLMLSETDGYERKKKVYKLQVLTGVAISTIAIFAGVIVGPAFPGAKSKAVIDTSELFQVSIDDRTVLNPIVDIRDRLTNDSEIEMFTVTSSRPTYWRTSTLREFTGTEWRATGSYKPVGKASEDNPPERKALSQEVKHLFEIQNLGGPWAPHAYLPSASSVKVDGDLSLLYNTDEANLVTQTGELERGDRYEMISSHLVATPLQLNEFSRIGTYNEDIIREYTGLPSNFPIDVAQKAREVTATGETAYEKMLLLQDWFLTEFEYSEEFIAGHNQDVMSGFIMEGNRKGFCEQFSSTFAAMARSLGIPSRVSIGFTPGEQIQANKFRVVAKDAHAWPEIYIPKIGWIEFEPTPTRGTPSARTQIGDQDVQIVDRLNPEQEEETTEGGTTTTTQPRTDTPTETTPTTTPEEPDITSLPEIPISPEPEEVPSETEEPSGTTTTTTPNTQPQETENEIVPPVPPDSRGPENPQSPQSSTSSDVVFIFLVSLLVLAILYLVGINFVRIKLLSSPTRKVRENAGTKNMKEFIPLLWLFTTWNLSFIGLSKKASETRLDFSKRAETLLGNESQYLYVLANHANAFQYGNKPMTAIEISETLEGARAINKKLKKTMNLAQILFRWVNPMPVVKLLKAKRKLKQATNPA